MLFQHYSVLQCRLQQGMTGPSTYTPFEVQPRSCVHTHMAYTIVKMILSVCVAHASLMLWYGPLVCSIHVRAEQLDPNSKVRQVFDRILSLPLHKVAGHIIATGQADYAIGYVVTVSISLAHQTSSQQASKEFLACMYLHALIACIGNTAAS